MNDKEFMELLENVRSEIIAYNDNDVFTVGDILDLIKRKDADIEMLKDLIKYHKQKIKEKEQKYNQVVDDMFGLIETTRNEIAEAKSEARKEFAEMIIKEYPEADYFIRNLLKEMEGEDNW